MSHRYFHRVEGRAVTSASPSDGPDTYTAGTHVPQLAEDGPGHQRSERQPAVLVVLANLSGFDGSPESMRKLQLEYGAEIGRAIVTSTALIAFCVISRYHGGAFVFSKMLNPRMTAVLAVDGSVRVGPRWCPGRGRGVRRRGVAPDRR